MGRKGAVATTGARAPKTAEASKDQFFAGYQQPLREAKRPKSWSERRLEREIRAVYREGRTYSLDELVFLEETPSGLKIIHPMRRHILFLVRDFKSGNAPSSAFSPSRRDSSQK